MNDWLVRLNSSRVPCVAILGCRALVTACWHECGWGCRVDVPAAGRAFGDVVGGRRSWPWWPCHARRHACYAAFGAAVRCGFLCHWFSGARASRPAGFSDLSAGETSDTSVYSRVGRGLLLDSRFPAELRRTASSTTVDRFSGRFSSLRCAGAFDHHDAHVVLSSRLVLIDSPASSSSGRRRSRALRASLSARLELLGVVR